jgi:hypothetical protein
VYTLLQVVQVRVANTHGYYYLVISISRPPATELTLISHFQFWSTQQNKIQHNIFVRLQNQPTPCTLSKGAKHLCTNVPSKTSPFLFPPPHINCKKWLILFFLIFRVALYLSTSFFFLSTVDVGPVLFPPWSSPTRTYHAIPTCISHHPVDETFVYFHCCCTR